jgi:hypothetical protein
MVRVRIEEGKVFPAPLKREHRGKNDEDFHVSLNIVEARTRELVQEIENMPDFYLLRPLIDFKDYQTILRNCVENGIDLESGDIETIVGYNSNGEWDILGKELQPDDHSNGDIIWAIPHTRGVGNPCFDATFEHGVKPGENFGALVLNGRLYHERGGEIYEQKDPSIRKEAILGVILFDASNNVNIPRGSLDFDLANMGSADFDVVKEHDYFIS